jgi:anti-sigma-K factor RskA
MSHGRRLAHLYAYTPARLTRTPAANCGAWQSKEGQRSNENAGGIAANVVVTMSDGTARETPFLVASLAAQRVVT